MFLVSCVVLVQCMLCGSVGSHFESWLWCGHRDAATRHIIIDGLAPGGPAAVSGDSPCPLSCTTLLNLHALPRGVCTNLCVCVYGRVSVRLCACVVTLSRAHHLSTLHDYWRGERISSFFSLLYRVSSVFRFIYTDMYIYIYVYV